MKVINHIGLSSGKDSTALWGWIINESGYPAETIRGTAADTENEYPEFYEQINALNEYGIKHGIQPIRILRSEGFLNLVLRKKRFPGACARFCTEVLKMIPALHYIEELQLEGYDVISHSGVRRDESDERAVLEEWGYDDFLKCRVRRPALDWRLEDVWKKHREYGLPINPLYFKGKTRVGCRLCCMSGKEDVRNTVLHFPETINLYRQWEKIVTDQRNLDWKENGDIRNGHASFFPADCIPEIQRTAIFTNKKGETYKVATIDDVARWSQTLRGGVQGGFDFMFQKDDSFSPCKMGYCE